MSRLGVVLTELVENALEHSDRETPTGEVTVDLEGTDEGQVRLTVADHGPGIPAAEAEFLALDRTVDQLYHGSGLGLAEAHWLAQLSGGD